MEYTKETINGIEIVRLSGNLMMADVRELRSVVKPLTSDPSVSKILINMSGVTMMDSSGIGFLTSGFTTAKKNQKLFALSSCNELITNIFKSVNLLDILTIFSTEDEALTNL